MCGETLRMGAQVNMAGQPAIGREGSPQSTPAWRAKRDIQRFSKGPGPLRKKCRLGTWQRLEINVTGLSIVGQMVVQIRDESIKR